MNAIENYFLADRTATVKIFRKALISWVLLHSLILIPASALMNDYEIHFSSSRTWFSSKMIELNSFFHGNINFVLIILLVQIIFCFVDLFLKESRLNIIAINIFYFFLGSVCISIWDGGNNIIQLLLLYSIFLTDDYKILRQGRNCVSHIVNNGVLVAARIQVAILYFVAGSQKISGELWGKGVALFYTFNVEEYSHPFLTELINEWPIISVAGSYSTVLFQIAFPFLIWFRELRGPFLFFGMLLHLGIAFGMGLFTFGLAMCVAYVAFYPQEKSKKLICFRKKIEDLQVYIFKKLASTINNFAK